jgi:hypothetical protein
VAAAVGFGGACAGADAGAGVGAGCCAVVVVIESIVATQAAVTQPVSINQRRRDVVMTVHLSEAAFS